LLGRWLTACADDYDIVLHDILLRVLDDFHYGVELSTTDYLLHSDDDYFHHATDYLLHFDDNYFHHTSCDDEHDFWRHLRGRGSMEQPDCICGRIGSYV